MSFKRAYERKVIVGIDTHQYVHVAVAIDMWGSRFGAGAW